MKFNPTQKKILKAGIVIVLLMVVIPPWNYTSSRFSKTYKEWSAGYSFIALPPLRKSLGGVTVDGSRLLVQLIVTIAATYVGIMLTVKKKEDK